MKKPSIYSASKIWHNVKWRKMRDELGYNITSRWINFECGSKGDPTGAKLLTNEEKRQLWIDCEYDTTTADMTIVYSEQEDEMRGALVEMGMAIGAGKPIYVIGDCVSFQVAGHSDVAFMRHPLVHRVDAYKYKDGSYAYASGYTQAMEHYLKHYRKVTNESITRSIAGVFEKATADAIKLLRAKETLIYQAN